MREAESGSGETLRTTLRHMCYQVKTKPTLPGQAGISQGHDARLGLTSLLFLGHLDVQADSYYTCPTCSDRKNQRAPLAVAHL